MQKQDFERIMSNLNAVIDICKECREKIQQAGEYGNLTINESNALITKAISAKSKMDKIIMNELYHLIGMGNLSGLQTSKLCAKIKILCSHRYLLERLVSLKPTTLSAGKGSNYNCQILDIKLSSSNAIENQQLGVLNIKEEIEE